MSIKHDIKYVECALQSYSEAPLVQQAWKNIRKVLLELGTSPNNGSTPCRFITRESIPLGGGHFQSVPFCNHEPSQRAVP